MHAAHTFPHQAAPPACIHTLATNNHSIVPCSCTPLTTATTTTCHKTERPRSSRLELAWRSELHLVVHNTRGALGAVAARLLHPCMPSASCKTPATTHNHTHTPACWHHLLWPIGMLAWKREDNLRHAAGVAAVKAVRPTVRVASHRCTRVLCKQAPLWRLTSTPTCDPISTGWAHRLWCQQHLYLMSFCPTSGHCLSQWRGGQVATLPASNPCIMHTTRLPNHERHTQARWAKCATHSAGQNAHAHGRSTKCSSSSITTGGFNCGKGRRGQQPQQQQE